MKHAHLHLALIGDYDPQVTAHQAIPLALQQAGAVLNLSVRADWLSTDTLDNHSALQRFDGFWCVPASPYRDIDGALLAIRYAREHQRPFLGTCAGFQHVLLEYARNVLGWTDAEHAELAPDAPRTVIAPLNCALLETTAAVRLMAYTRIAEAYGCMDIHEAYRCRYGVNRDLEPQLLEGNLIGSARDAAGDLRAVELLDHPFFIATLFQPERAALSGTVVPLVTALLKACGASSK
ncbi:CTP synthase C-terminal region-related (seleno)protein [Pseudomonas mucidolens]|uniref:CTP synthase (glutamine hydrolyzing) n=1 Tax=Pseudomonas mucidolens TaxID=46679 RepID=A0A1H2LW44_9PSED|nr:CTP synthase [Pseudomonas mucidolens]SDU85223.1 Glutamine amidotransferase class-I [Pseudomonas mucidolens]SQH35147.1 CTP synthetase [Pseudomonas mucidolens]